MRMKKNKIRENLKDITPEQQLELLHSLIEQEKKGEDKQFLLTLLQEARKKQELLGEELQQEQIVRKVEEKEPALEQLISEEAMHIPKDDKKKEPLSLYGVNNVGENIKYEREEEKEKDLNGRPLTLKEEEESIAMRDAQRLDRERRRYHSSDET